MLIAGTGLLGTSPALAADAPSFDQPSVPTGFATVQLTGQAAAGAKVTLRERAYIWRGDAKTGADLPVADEYEDEMPVTVTANASGRWTISRNMDSGFVWAVESGGLYSPIVTAPMKVGGTLDITSSAANTIRYRFHASPDQPWFPVRIERQSGSTWVPVASGVTDGPAGEGGATPPNDDNDKEAEFQGTADSQPGGQQTYRAVVAEEGKPAYASEENLIQSNTFTDTVTVAGTGGGNPSTPPSNPGPSTPPSNPGPSTPPSNPGPSTPPTTPAPKPTAPAAGSVQFTRVQYNAPGKDTKKNKSVNGEYFKLTNKTKKTINLKGWTVRDRAGNLYRFTSNYYLGAGKSVTVHTGKGSNKSSVRYWGKAKHVWNNGGDTATLRTSNNKTIDTCRWNKPGKGYTTC